LVCTYCYADDRFHYSVNFNDETAAYEATKYLIGLGHDKIAIITGRVDSLPCQDRLRGYQRAIMDNNLLINPLHVKVGNWEYESGYQLTKELINSDIPPTAIFAMNDLMAGGVIDAARELNVNVPQDLSVIGFDNREMSFYYVPKLTTIEIPLNEMGKEACKLLIERLTGTESEQRHLKVKCRLIERQSVKNLIIEM
jgi:LacI family transcriptional regulator